MPKYYVKEVGGDVYLPDGRKIQSDFEYGGDGFISTGVGYIVHQISLAIAQGIGGFREITQLEYEENVKKKQLQPQAPRPNSLYRANQPLNQRANAAGAVVASSIEVPVPPKPDPIRVPTPDQMKPRKGPIPKEAFI